jgi:hypothetical protein
MIKLAAFSFIKIQRKLLLAVNFQLMLKAPALFLPAGNSICSAEFKASTEDFGGKKLFTDTPAVPGKTFIYLKLYRGEGNEQ